MANEPKAPEGTGGMTGLPPADQPAGTSPTAPTAPEGRAGGEGAPAEGRATAPDAAFDLGVDPSTLPPELKSLWEQTHGQMKSSFTRRMQELGTYREKVAAYDAFMADPVGQLQNLAAQQGFTLTRREAAQALQQGQPGSPQAAWDPASGQDPPSWQAVAEYFERKAEEKYAPVLSNVRRLQAQSVEQQLDSIDKDWRQYEPTMRTLLQRHPTLSGDIPELYRLAIPPEVHHQRAVAEVQERMRHTASAARVGSAQTTATTQPAPKKAGSFQEAVEIARGMVARGEKP